MIHRETNPAPAPPLSFEMVSQPRYLSAVRAMIHSVAQRLGFNEAGANQISLAVDEALCNVINHGYQRREDGRIRVSVWPIDNIAGVRIVIDDDAPQVDLATIHSRDLDDVRPGGLGVHIIREVMDEVIYTHRPEGGMRLELIKHIEGQQEDDNA
ncbi:MAG: ATP-binding protein [Phycisphaerales bacterium]